MTALLSDGGFAQFPQVRRFDIMIGGEIRGNLSEEQVEDLYRAGEVARKTSCRVTGKRDWQTIDECLPILKYVHRNVATAASARATAAPSNFPAGRLESSRVPAVEVETNNRQKPALTTALKAGWICFGIGALVAWVFPPAFLFYSVALVMAIVAMCTHQVNRGLILLLSSFVAMGTSAFLSFILAVGIFAAALKPVVERAERDRGRLERNERELEQQLQRSQQRLNRTMERSFSTLGSMGSSVRQSSAVQPIPSFQPATQSQQERLEEIARIEAKERQLRQQGRSLDPITQDYLQKLRAAYDRESRR